MIEELNENGKIAFRHKYCKTLFVERAYGWVHDVVVIDETESRRIIDVVKIADFNFEDWIPITREEYKKVKQGYKDIYA